MRWWALAWMCPRPRQSAGKRTVILPTHRLLDACGFVKSKTPTPCKAKIGSTLKGIGPTYMDKTGRNGLRIGDIESSHFESRYHALRDKHVAMLSGNLKDSSTRSTTPSGSMPSPSCAG